MLSVCVTLKLLRCKSGCFHSVVGISRPVTTLSCSMFLGSSPARQTEDFGVWKVMAKYSKTAP